MLVCHTTEGSSSEVWNLLFFLKVTNQLRDPRCSEVPPESTSRGDRVVRSGGRPGGEKLVSFDITPRGKLPVAVTAGTGYPKGVCVCAERTKTLRRVLFPGHCLSQKAPCFPAAAGPCPCPGSVAGWRSLALGGLGPEEGFMMGTSFSPLV